MAVIDVFAREYLAIQAALFTRARYAINIIGGLGQMHGVPERIRSGDGPERIAKNPRRRFARRSTKTIHVTPDSPWEYGHCE